MASPPAARRGRVLVAEDDVRLGRLLAQSLTKPDWEVVVVHDGQAAFDRGLVGDEDGPFDVLLLDWMLPGRDAMTVCRELRRQGIWTPALMLTARSTTPDTVARAWMPEPTTTWPSRSTSTSCSPSCGPNTPRHRDLRRILADGRDRER